MSKQQALQVYLACVTLTVACVVYEPHFPLSDVLWVVPLVFGTILLQNVLGKNGLVIGFAMLIPAVVLSLAVRDWNRPVRVFTSQLPSYLKGYETQSRGIVSVLVPGETVDQHPGAAYWIHAPVSTVEGLLTKNGTQGRGFDSTDDGCLAHVNFATGESWNLYSGQRDIPKFPALTGSSVHPGSEAGWCTLVYRSAYRSG
ncbi:MAG: hypothetical protein ACHQ50_02925 [Fimbriimonadales bacterium]